MATTTSLQTQTVTLLDMLGNGRRFSVPRYQRDYSWKEEQWEDLWTDLMEMEVSRSAHYMGAVVLEEVDDRHLRVIDGQQRLATLSLLALAIIAGLQGMAAAGIESADNNARADELRKRFISERNPATLLQRSKLELNATDDGFYQDYLVPLRDPPVPRALRGSNQFLWQCFNFFRSKVTELVDRGYDGRRLAELLSEIAARSLLFIQVTVKDDVSAFTVFETLNARRLELSSTDLLKNFLFSKLRVDSDADAMQRRWTGIVNLVPAPRLPNFLRYHLMTGPGRIRKGNLFKIMRERVREPMDVFPLMDELSARAHLDAALRDDQSEFWADTPECRPLVRDLRLFASEQATPLLFAVLEKLPSSSWTQVLRIVANCMFRFVVVGRRNTNRLEPVFQAAAVAVMDGSCASPQQVFYALRELYPADAEFKADFSKLRIETDGPRKRLAKYVLGMLERDREAQRIELDTASVEHVLPENPAQEWHDAVPERNWPDLVFRLGNLALLEANLNRAAGNAAYVSKREHYEKSAYGLTRSIATEFPGGWSAETIEQRQAALARRAVHIWREDFPLR